MVPCSMTATKIKPPNWLATTIPPGQRFYTIKRGDTLAAIAAAFEVTDISLVETNGLDNPDDIQAGQTIKIPSGIVVVAELPTPSLTTP